MMENLQIPEGLNKTSFASIIDQYDSFFFDCDGVLFNGSNYLAPTYEALNKLKELGKNVFFVTNSSKNSRRYMFDRIKVGGFEPDVDKIFTSSYLAAKYLNINHPNVTKVYVVGLEGLKDELELQNIQVVGGQEDTNKDMSVSLFDDLVVDDDIQAVVVGVDYGFNYYKLAYASVALQKGALFIATNLDANIKMAKFKMPGGGCMVKALEHSCDIKPYIVGKPNPDVIDVAIKSYGLDRKRCLMIGDRLDTDVMLGKNAGIDTFAVLTGVTSEDDLFKEAQGENPNLPTYYWERVEI